MGKRSEFNIYSVFVKKKGKNFSKLKTPYISLSIYRFMFLNERYCNATGGNEIFDFISFFGVIF